MQVQTYGLKPLQEVELPSADEGLEEVARRNALMEELGFEARLHHEKKTAEQSQKFWLARQMYPEMTGKSLKLWRRFLPTSCKRSDFKFDEIPIEALEAIKTASESNCFDKIEIWTPEGNNLSAYLLRALDAAKESTREALASIRSKVDPMAVGIVIDEYGKRHYFQIVRWGEALLPLKKIKKYVRSVRQRAAVLLGVVPAVVAAMLIAGYIIAFLTFGFWPVVGVTAAACAILFVVMLFAVASEADGY